MPTVKVPIFQPVFRGVDSIELNDDNFYLIDGVRTLKGGTQSRPGSKGIFAAATATGFGFDGLFWWSEKNVVIGVGGGELYQLKLVSNTPIITSLTNGTPLLNQNKPCSIVVDGTNVYAANGGQIVYTTVDGTPQYIPDPHAPGSVTQLAYLDGYILAINGTNTFYWSDVNAGLSWNPLSFAQASGSPDLIQAIKVFNREIYLFGARSCEVWENDGSASTFSRIPGGMIEAGCSAPFSVIQDENSLYWFDENRRLIRFAGKSIERLSTKFDRQLQGLSTFSDCRAFKIQQDGYVLFVFTFPQADKTYVYNQSTDDWAEWGRYIYSDAEYERWIAQCYVYAEGWGTHLIGRRDKLVVAELSKNYFNDDGDVSRLYRLTGHIDYGTSKVKQSNELRFRAKRGVGLSTATPKLMLRYKIDNREWSNIKEFSLGDVGEYNLILRDTRRKQFRTIQYEFSATDAVDIVFSDAEEDIEVLR